ncbi:MAG TPA: helix-turn-helix transcriptional regulator [Actinophytocola sp.]|uniref:helix-turn-helix domain-containing protein n=1 Tax=Actinophytocola sp. TaxID=1872138 RepID=UPI002DBE87EC|nr:helix-turn-helix transcriptional regulator [Actinophytocola sp.]HEU5471101.1 helix-turn-helix transcriptional regulator [Actinophytocola sp.]
MSEDTTGSTVPRRQLGRYLRDLRGKARLTVKAAAQELEWSEAKIWRIETGQTSLRSLDVEAMCRVYDAPADLTDALKGLAKETKGRGWWHAYGDVIPDSFDLYIGLEEAAAELRWYEAELVPGLFQTAAYARALIRAGRRDVDDEEIERAVAVRMARQPLLTRNAAAPTVSVVLNEAILRRPVGGWEVMVEQIEHLVELANLPNVMMRVVPFNVGLHHGLITGPFVILRFPTNGESRMLEPPTVYVDGFTGDLYLDKPNEIEQYDTAFNLIWDIAAGESQSQTLLKKAVRELES